MGLGQRATRSCAGRGGDQECHEFQLLRLGEELESWLQVYITPNRSQVTNSLGLIESTFWRSSAQWESSAGVKPVDGEEFLIGIVHEVHG